MGKNCTNVRRTSVARGPHQLHTWRLAPSNLPRSVGLAPVFPPTQGRFGHGAVHTQPTPVQPLQFVIAQTHSPQPGTRRQPIPESADWRWTRNICPWRPTLSTGKHRRCLAQVRWEPGAGRRRTDCLHGERGSSTSQGSSEIWNPPVVGLVLAAGQRGGLRSFALGPSQAQPWHGPARFYQCLG